MSSGYGDTVTDLAIDATGSRLAVASLNHSVSVWAWRGGDARAPPATPPAAPWVCTAKWVAAFAPVWRLAWAPPCFGPLLAAGSLDHSVVVWREPPTSTPASSTTPAPTKWLSLTTLGDARSGVTAVVFAPKHLGLQLAAASSDGSVRIYTGDPGALTNWEFSHELGEGQPRPPVTALSWATCPVGDPLLAVGTAQGGVCVWRCAGGGLRSWSPLASCTGGHTGPVHDLAWAPGGGRVRLASCGGDGSLVVWRLFPPGEVLSPPPPSSALPRVGRGGAGGGVGRRRSPALPGAEVGAAC